MKLREALRLEPIVGEPRLYEFRPVGPIPVWTQACAVTALWTATVLLTYHEFRTHGTSFGYAGPAAWLLFVPITEELIFRGFVLDQLVRRVRPWSAVALSSLLFGLWHLRNVFWKEPDHAFEQVLAQMVFAGLMFGPVAGFITLRFRTLWPAVILHFANNLMFFAR